MRHRIELRAYFTDDMRSIVWDDVRGTVSGDHDVVPELAAVLAAPTAELRWLWGGMEVRGHATEPPDFLAVLYQRIGGGFPPTPAMRLRLPDSLAGIEPTVLPMPEDPTGENWII